MIGYESQQTKPLSTWSSHSKYGDTQHTTLLVSRATLLNKNVIATQNFLITILKS